jgi:hypothetical protein
MKRIGSHAYPSHVDAESAELKISG